MNKFLVLIVFVSLQSCQFFDKKVPDEKELLQQELKKINWKEVDQWPSFVECDSISDKENQRNCFYQMMLTQLQEKLRDDSIAKLFPQLDSIQVKVTIFSDSKVKFEPIISDSITLDRMQLDSIFQISLADFPKVNPAIKRGIPVKTEFQLPIVLNK